jgi:hypothetical protein
VAAADRASRPRERDPARAGGPGRRCRADRPAGAGPIDDRFRRTCEGHERTAPAAGSGRGSRRGPDGRVRADPVDRVRERRESAARPRSSPTPGNRHPPRTRRQPGTRGSTAADRKRPALARGRPAGLRRGALVVRTARGSRAARAAPSRGADRTRLGHGARRSSPRGGGGAGGDDGHPGRDRAGVAPLEAGSAHRHETGPGGLRPRQTRRSDAGHPRWRPGGAVHDAGHRGRTPAAGALHHVHRRSGLRVPPRGLRLPRTRAERIQR